MSAKLDIFNDIVTELEEVSEIETIGIWNNQFDNEAEEISFNFPAVFVEFADIPWISTNQHPSRSGSQGNIAKEQKAPGTLITLHIGFSELKDETKSFPDIDAILDTVYFKIQGLGANKDFYSALLRVAERQDTDHNRVIDWQMDFSTEMFQCGELDEDLTKIDARTLDLETDIDLDIDNDVIRTGDGEV